MSKTKDDREIKVGEPLGEDSLTEVTGGAKNGDKCYFEPEIPYNYRKVDNYIIVKCKSRCHTIGESCSCHGHPVYCDRWHTMVHLGGGVWCGDPGYAYNHKAPHKLVVDIDVSNM